MAVLTNKVHFGLKNAYYAPVTEVTTTSGTSTTYGTPVALSGAVSLTLSSDQETSNFYADDGVYYITQSDAKYSGELEIADIPDQFYKDIFGDTEDSSGALVEISANAIKYFALLFETSGDAGGHRTVLYKCSATRPTVNGKTKEDSVEVQTQTISLSAIPRADVDTIGGASKHIVQSNVKEGASAYANFFSAVYEPTFT